MSYPETPTLDRIREVKADADVIAAFLEWCEEQGYVLSEWRDDEWSEPTLFPVNGGIEHRLAEYFGIDLQKKAEEQDAVLEHVRSMNQ